MVTEGKGSGYHLELKLIYPVEPSVHSVSPQCLVMAEGGSKFLPLPLQKQKKRQEEAFDKSQHNILIVHVSLIRGYAFRCFQETEHTFSSAIFYNSSFHTTTNTLTRSALII